VLLGVGVGPLRTEDGRDLTRTIFDLADVAFVRDQGSLDLLEEIGASLEHIDVSGDLAFAAPRIPLPPSASSFLAGLPRPILGVALRHWTFGVDSESWESEVARAIHHWQETSGGTPLFISMQTGSSEIEDDVAVAHRMIGRLRNPESAALLPEGLSPLERFRAVGACDLVLGMRMHSIVAALRSGVRCVGLAYDPKVDALALAMETDEVKVERLVAGRDEIVSALGQGSERGSMTHDTARGLFGQVGEGIHSAVATILSCNERNGGLRDAGQGWLSELTLAHSRRLGHLETDLSLFNAELARLKAALANARAGQARDRDRLDQAETLASDLSLHLQSTSIRLAVANAERTALEGSRGWALLRLQWTIVWSLRELARRVGLIRVFDRIRGALSTTVSGVLVGGRRTFRTLLPFWLRRVAFVSGPGRYRGIDRSRVVLYTEREDVFPGYAPRVAVSGRPTFLLKTTLIATMKDEASSISRWFQSLERQTRLPDEVILVDGGSKDGTVAILSSLLDCSSLAVRVIQAPGSTIAQARNIAAKLASNPILVMTDLGCSLRSDWLARLCVPFEVDPATEVVAGWYEPLAHTMIGRSGAHLLVPRLSEIDPQTFLPSARSMAVRMVAWERVKGQPEWLSRTGEDTFCDLELKRLAQNWAFVPDAIVDWHAPETIGGIWRRLRGWSEGDGESGVRGDVYWRRAQVLAVISISMAMLAGAFVVLAAVGPLLYAFVIALPIAVALVLAFPLSWRRSMRPADVVWAMVGQYAEAIGYVRGALRRQQVRARRDTDTTGVSLVLSGVPMDDSGGGSRGAQFAQELLRRGQVVAFFYKFTKDEAVELGLPLDNPRLFHTAIDDLDWEAFRWEFGELLTNSMVLALVEFPLPDFVPMLKALREDGARIVFDVIDDWRTSLGGNWYSRETEGRVAGQADLLTATAVGLQTRLEAETGRPAVLVPNAVDAVAFDPSRAYERPVDLPDVEFTAIYVGALWGEWFDWDLLVKSASSNPEAAFVIIGDYRGQCPVRLPNLHFLGLRPQSSLPAYLANADVGIIPWKVGRITEMTSPLKAYEYLAMGLPVVAPDLPALPDHPLVVHATDPADFATKIHSARTLRGTPEVTGEFRRLNSWSARLEVLMKALDSAGKGGAPEIAIPRLAAGY
jgi:glycosyltransferase involved in cell wall biosynthesis